MYFSLIFKDTVPPSCMMIFRPTQFAHRSNQLPTVITLKRWIPTSCRLTAGLASTLQLHCENTHLGVKSRGQLGKHRLWIHKILGLNLAHIVFSLYLHSLKVFKRTKGEGHTWQTPDRLKCTDQEKYDLYHPWPNEHGVLKTNKLIIKKAFSTFVISTMCCAILVEDPNITATYCDPISLRVQKLTLLRRREQ